MTSWVAKHFSGGRKRRFLHLNLTNEESFMFCYIKRKEVLDLIEIEVLQHTLETVLEKPVLKNYKENHMTLNVRKIVELSFKRILDRIGKRVIGIENYGGQARIIMDEQKKKLCNKKNRGEVGGSITKGMEEKRKITDKGD